MFYTFVGTSQYRMFPVVSKLTAGVRFREGGLPICPGQSRTGWNGLTRVCRLRTRHELDFRWEGDDLSDEDRKKKQPAGLDHGGRIESQQVGYLDIRRWHVWITRTINSSYHPPPRIPTQDVEIITRERLFTHPGTNRIFCTQSSWAIFWTRAKESKRPTLGRKTFFQKLPKPGTGYAWKSGWSLWRLV